LSNKTTIHIIPQFHYDLEYILTLEEYMEISFNNLLEAHRILSKYDEYTFMVEQVVLFESFLLEYPSLRNDFKKWALEGRFTLASGMYTMADVAIPSGESLIRQLITGIKWSEKNLGGYRPICLNNGDCPGGHRQMPQISKHCGYDYYIFERGIDDHRRKSEFIWTGIDGTEIKTYWLPLGYGGWRPSHGAGDDVAILKQAIEESDKHCFSNCIMLPNGGDFRYPDEGGIAAVHVFNKDAKKYKACYSTYKAGLATIDWSDVPTSESEFLPDRQGEYSNRILLKQLNREFEFILFCAEALSITCRCLLNIQGDSEGLERAWKLIFLNQSHDTIWGTITDHSYDRALIRYNRARIICDRIINRSMSAIFASISEIKPSDVLVYNPLPWDRECWVDLDNEVNDYVSPLIAHKTREIKSKGTWIKLPANGYCLWNTAELVSSDLSCFNVKNENGKLLIETPFYNATISKGGAISELRGKDPSATIFTNPAKPFFNTICYQTDNGDMMYCYESPLIDALGKSMERDLTYDPCPESPRSSMSGNKLIGKVIFSHQSLDTTSIKVESKDADRLIILINGRIGPVGYNQKYIDDRGTNIKFTQRIIFYSRSPRIDCKISTEHIKGKHYRLRVVFPVGFSVNNILHEIPFGETERPQGEFVAQNYLCCEDEEKGMAILNKGIPGNNVTDNVMMLSLMRSSYQEYLDPCEKASEEGTKHEFEYAILPYSVKEKPNFAREGIEFNMPPYSSYRGDAFSEDIKKDKLAQQYTGFSISALEICCSAIYEDGDSTIVRMHNSTSLEVETKFDLPVEFRSISETNALLKKDKDVILKKNKVVIVFEPFEIKTFSLRKILL